MPTYSDPTRHILLVDADPQELNSLSARLNKLDADVFVGSSQHSGESMINLRLDLAIVDIRLPDGSGIDLIRLLRAHEKHSDLPIIAISRSEDIHLMKAALEAGARDFVEKPINLDLLEVKALSMINSHRTSLLASRLAARLDALHEDNRLLTEHLRLNSLSSRIGAWEWQACTRALYWNEQSYQMFGQIPLQRSDTYRLWSSSVHPDDLDLAQQCFSGILSGTGPFEAEYRIQRPDGSVRLIRSLAKNVSQSGASGHVLVGTYLDITGSTDRTEQSSTQRSHA